MKAQILKIAGVKSEKEFYKKYPSEEAFMKVHGKAFKKAQIGTSMNNSGATNKYDPINVGDYIDKADLNVTGSTSASRADQAYKMALLEATAAKNSGGGGGEESSGGGMDMGSMMKMFGGSGGDSGGDSGMGGMLSSLSGMLGGGRNGTSIPKAQNGESWQGSMFNQPSIPEEEYTPGTVSLTDDQVQNEGGQYDGYAFQGGPDTGAKQGPSKGAKMMKSLDPIGISGKLAEGYDKLRGERRARKAAEQQRAISDVTREAYATEDVDKNTQRKYVRPEDNINSGSAFFPVYGVGTNPLARNGGQFQSFQDGGYIGGNPTEIQNTYGNGYNIYDDGGYEPLNDSNVKQYYHGGRIHQMQDGASMATSASSMASGAGGGMNPIYGQIAKNVGGATDAAYGDNAGADIGGTVGESAGMIFGPLGKMIGKEVGKLAGWALDRNPQKIKKAQEATQNNITAMALGQASKGLQSQYHSYMKDGGYMNPEYNPQLITMFGDHNAQDFADYAHKDQYRAGGHLKSYTPPSERAMEIYEDGGNVNNYELGGVEVESGGHLEPISYNPNNAGTGITSMIRGQSHDDYDSKLGHSGVILNAYGNQVEAERGEPIREMEEGGSVGEDKSAVITGNLVYKNLNNMFDPKYNKYQDKKIKNIHKEIALKDQKLNKLEEKNTKELIAYDPKNSIDKLTLSSLQAKELGYKMQYKNNAEDANYFTNHQAIINDTAEEQGLVADDLAKGRVKIDKEAQPQYAKFGGSFTKAQDGDKIKKFNSPEEASAAGYKLEADGKYHLRTKGATPKPTVSKLAVANKDIPRQSRSSDGLYGGITPAQFEEYKKKNDWYDWTGFNLNRPGDVLAYENAFNTKAKEYGSDAYLKPDDAFGQQVYSANINMNKNNPASLDIDQLAEINPATNKEVVKDKFPWEGYANQLINYLRPSDQEGLDTNQLSGEMYALSSNQLEPVPAQGYQPDLSVPYDISFQDQLNANQADYRAMQRMTGYNPSAQANLNAQKYQANQGVLGNQFRANQEMKDKVYGENRNILNQAKLTNLGIFDKQYERQAQALSNTKATTQAALSSIADKYAKNKLENRTLGVMENMYNYRYDDQGRAINMNPLAQFNMQGRGISGKDTAPEGYEYETILKKKKKKEDTAKNGSVVRSYKNI